MIENFQAICIDTVYACAAFVGTAVAIYGLTRSVKILSGGVKCLAAASLAGSLIIGGMVVTNVRIAGAKTNDTQQVGGDLSRTNDVVQVGGDAGTNGVEPVGGDEGTNGVPRVGGLALGALNLDGPQEPSAEPTLDIVSVDVDVEEGVVRIDAELSNYGSTVAFSDVRVVTTDNLTDGTWTPIAPMEVGVMGNAISVVVPAAGVIRFYRLQVGDGIGLAALGMFNVGVGADAPVAEPLDPDGDEDGDGVSNGDEEIEGTNPLAPDTDGDGLTDGEELNVTHTNPLNADTDGDGIPDSVRFTVLKLDVCVDGLNEQQEEEIGAFVGKGTADATVAFSCEPDDLPSSDYVAIETTGSAQLLEVLASGETVVASSAYRANEIGSRRFVLRGTSASSVDGDGTVKISHTASGAQDLAKFTVVEVDIAAHDLDHGLQQTVPETEEETVGAYIHYNIDDDDASGIWTPEYVKRPGADFEQESMARTDDDLKRLNATVVPYGARGALEFITSKVSIYGLDTCKRTENLVCKNGWGRVYSLASQENLMRFGPVFPLMAEGRAKGEGYVELRFHAPYGKVISDRVKYTCIAADCGDQPWVPPANPPQSGTPQLESLFNRQYATGAFLDLKGCEWSVIGEASKYYNCLAWAVGRTDVFFDGIVFDDNGRMIERKVDRDGKTWVKIDAVYGNGNGILEIEVDVDAFFLHEADMVPTENLHDAEVIYYDNFHAAKRKHCNCGESHWTMFESKCGEKEIIEHRPRQLESVYGEIRRMYKPMSIEE